VSPTKDDRLAELCALHYLGEFGPRVARRLDELFSMPHGDHARATAELLNACEHLGVTGERLEEVVARLPEGQA
jgi:hypothetical protein